MSGESPAMADQPDVAPPGQGPRKAQAPRSRRARRGATVGLTGHSRRGDAAFGGSARGAAWFLLILMGAIAAFLVTQALTAINHDTVNFTGTAADGSAFSIHLVDHLSTTPKVTAAPNSFSIAHC